MGFPTIKLNVFPFSSVLHICGWQTLPLLMHWAWAGTVADVETEAVGLVCSRGMSREINDHGRRCEKLSHLELHENERQWVWISSFSGLSAVSSHAQPPIQSEMQRASQRSFHERLRAGSPFRPTFWPKGRLEVSHMICHRMKGNKDLGVHLSRW